MFPAIHLKVCLAGLAVLADRGFLFGIPLKVGDTSFQIGFFTSVVSGLFDICRNLTADEGADETHELLGFAQISAANGIYDDRDRIVNLVFEFLRPQLAAQVVTNARLKDS